MKKKTLLSLALVLFALLVSFAAVNAYAVQNLTQATWAFSSSYAAIPAAGQTTTIDLQVTAYDGNTVIPGCDCTFSLTGLPAGVSLSAEKDGFFQLDIDDTASRGTYNLTVEVTYNYDGTRVYTYPVLDLRTPLAASLELDRDCVNVPYESYTEAVNVTVRYYDANGIAVPNLTYTLVSSPVGANVQNLGNGDFVLTINPSCQGGAWQIVAEIRNGTALVGYASADLILEKEDSVPARTTLVINATNTADIPPAVHTNTVYGTVTVYDQYGADITASCTNFATGILPAGISGGGANNNTIVLNITKSAVAGKNIINYYCYYMGKPYYFADYIILVPYTQVLTKVCVVLSEDSIKAPYEGDTKTIKATVVGYDQYGQTISGLGTILNYRLSSGYTVSQTGSCDYDITFNPSIAWNSAIDTTISVTVSADASDGNVTLTSDDCDIIIGIEKARICDFRLHIHELSDTTDIFVYTLDAPSYQLMYEVAPVSQYGLNMNTWDDASCRVTGFNSWMFTINSYQWSGTQPPQISHISANSYFKYFRIQSASAVQGIYRITSTVSYKGQIYVDWVDLKIIKPASYVKTVDANWTANTTKDSFGRAVVAAPSAGISYFDVNHKYCFLLFYVKDQYGVQMTNGYWCNINFAPTGLYARSYQLYGQYPYINFDINSYTNAGVYTIEITAWDQNDTTKEASDIEYLVVTKDKQVLTYMDCSLDQWSVSRPAPNDTKQITATFIAKDQYGMDINGTVTYVLSNAILFNPRLLMTDNVIPFNITSAIQSKGYLIDAEVGYDGKKISKVIGLLVTRQDPYLYRLEMTLSQQYVLVRKGLSISNTVTVKLQAYDQFGNPFSGAEYSLRLPTGIRITKRNDFIGEYVLTIDYSVQGGKNTIDASADTVQHQHRYTASTSMDLIVSKKP